MLVQLATIAGRGDRPNEDFPAALPDPGGRDRRSQRRPVAAGQTA
jgi:hypothetical protein